MSDADLLRFRLNHQILNNIDEINNSKAKSEQNAILRQQLASQGPNDNSNRKLREELEDKEIENISLQREVAFYKDLLAKPMYEIANQNENFKKTYDLQQELLANWMVSQRAFKELAIDLGLDLGKNKEEIINEGMAQRINVLDNKTKHDNDLGNDFYVKPYVDKIKKNL